MIRRLVLALLVLALTLSTTAAFAGRGHGGTTTPPSSIDLETYSQPWLGGTVGFTTDAQGLAGYEYPMYAVWCYQDLNGDGKTTVDGTWNVDSVYMELRKPAEELMLGGAGSMWLTNGGTAACDAILYAYGWKGGKESIRTLAWKKFSAAGGAP
jgi:hypothetical protein